MDRNVKILIFSLLLSSKLFAGDDRAYQSGTGMLFQTGGANTRMSINTAGDIFFTNFTSGFIPFFTTSGELTEEQFLSKARGGAGANQSSVTYPSTGVLTVNDATQTLDNKTIDADNNTITNLAHGSEVDNASSGVHGASSEILASSDSQIITNKDIDGGTMTNGNRFTLPSGTTVNLDSLTDKEGNIAYDTTLDRPVFNDGTDWISVISNVSTSVVLGANIEGCRTAGAGGFFGSDTCATWVTSFVRNSAGDYTLNMSGSAFGLDPSCACSPIGTSPALSCQIGVGATSRNVLIRDDTNTPTDTGLNIICHGQQ